jgi:nucleotide-binding universal stress UspA family protein
MVQPIDGRRLRQAVSPNPRIGGEENTDLIVIGVRGRNPVDLTFFGSTANHVVRRASCPVLSLRQ